MCLPDNVGLPFTLEAQVCFICSLITLCGPVCGLHALLSMEVAVSSGSAELSELAVSYWLATLQKENRGES